MKSVMKAHSILHEVEITYKRPILDVMPLVGSSKDAENVLRKCFDQNRIDLKEFFFVMLLSNSSHVLGISELSSGSIIGTVVNIKEIFQLALKANASAIVLAHNHPSGNLKPSRADNELTGKIKNACCLLDLNLLDHIILTSEGYYSFADNGIL